MSLRTWIEAWRKRREEKRDADAYRKRVVEGGWFVAILCASLQSSGCWAHRLHAEEARCVQAIRAATTEAQVREVVDACHENLEQRRPHRTRSSGS